MTEKNCAPLEKPRQQTGTSISPVHPLVSSYLEVLHSNRDEEVLCDMESYARREQFPIVGRLAGVFLEMLARMVKARRVIELGSGFGYSAYWFTRGIGPEGLVYCTDGDQDNRMRAEEFLRRTGRWSQVDYRTGYAQEILQSLPGEFDVIYNDVDKGDYPEIWNMARAKVRPGGLYIADNVLWGGRVVMSIVEDDVVPGWTEAIREHNELIARDPDFECFINPIRDGLLVARKKDD